MDNIIIVNESPQEVLVQITSLRGDAGTNGIDAKISIIGNNGTDITAEPKLNFTGGLGAIDDSINLKTDVKLDITNLTLETSLSDDDIIAFYDTSTIMHKKSILSTIKTYILGTLFNISTGHNHDGQNSKIISGSYLAPTTASYLVLGLDSSLSNEKKLIAGSGISLITNTSSSTLSIDNNIIAGSGIVLINNINASSITISSTISASSIAFLTTQNNFTLMQAIGETEIRPTGVSTGNTLVGKNSGKAISTGIHCTFLGMSAGLLNNSAVNNTFIGYYAGLVTTTGGDNTGVGAESLKLNVGGINNVAFGSYALRGNIEGNGNTALGVSSLAVNDGGYANTAIGWASLSHNIGTTDHAAGSFNTAVGTNSLLQNVSGNYNVAVGIHSLAVNPNKSYNTAIGGDTLMQSLSGYNNTTLGYRTGYSNIAGNSNVFLGYEAGYYETGNSKLFIDNSPRTNEADARIRALIYGVFDVAAVNQSLTFNAGSMGFFGHVATAQPTKAEYNNWNTLSDVVAALVSIGILDTA